MEEQITVPTGDGHLIYGTLNVKRRQDRLIIFVHGITGNKDEHQFFNAPAYFNDKYETFRFNLYCGEDKARNLSDCSIAIHAQDLQTVIRHFAPHYKSIYLVGHSLGCPVILRANLDKIEKIVLWDPTIGLQSLNEWDCSFSPELNRYVLHWGQDILVSKDIIDDWKGCCNLASEIKRIKKPCKFIFAGANPVIQKAWLPLVKHHSIPYAIVDGATHCFVEEGAERALYEAARKFLG